MTLTREPLTVTIRPVEAARSFEPPGPGSWKLDAEHCERPHSRWVADLFPALYTAGFRAGMAHYGALLDTIEMAMVHGFAYMAPRPVGAPPDAKGTPPRALFWLLTRLHPEIRRRVRRSEEVFRTRLWREDTRAFFEDVMPRSIEFFERVQALDLEALDDEALIEHLDDLVEKMEDQVRDHFLRATAPMLPVGEFVLHVREWTGCSPSEAVALLNGYSPYSVEAVEELDAVAGAIRADARAREILGVDGGGAPGSPSDDAGARAVLDALRALDGPVAEAVARWLDRVGQRIVTGHDVAELRGIELPSVLVSTLRAHVESPPREELRARTDAATVEVRARVPAEQRDRFDELLAEARLVHPLRDAHSVIDFWGMGLVRRSLLEAGRRLHERRGLHAPDHVVDLTQAELVCLLRGGEGPSPDEVAAHVAWRTSTTMVDAPEVLGPAPAPPPPTEWLPAPAARAARAVETYFAMMWDAGESAPTPTVTGIGASAGRHVGTARLVLAPEDFARVREGDVLVARITTPAYNVLLPLLGAVVTDRGGLLSHPAIVTREFGIPGVVGTRDATTRIRDGATVEVDGEAGTVRVLA